MPEQDIIRASDDLDDVIHCCLLNEVFLLLDFISGRADCSLSGLDGMIDPAAPDQPLTTAQALTLLNHIRYPPPNSPNDRARDATILLQAKDRLNIVSWPATGLSIAYTTMFAGGASDGRESRLGAFARRSELLSWMFASGNTDAASRATLAAYAYPSLVGSARRFRGIVFLLMFGVVIATGTSVWISYQVALGKSLMLRFDALDRQQRDLTDRIYAAEQDTMALGGASKALRLCDTSRVASTVAHQELCDVYADWQHKNALAYRDLENYSHAWSVHAVTPHPPSNLDANVWDDDTGAGANTDDQSEQLSANVLTAFSTTALPVQFSLLGSAAAVVRNIYGHVRARTLTPRQLNLALIRLLLGLVAGVSVGLLFSSDVAPIQGGAGLAAGLTLSASGVAFLAGYGVDAVFSLFDAVLKRVFTLDFPDPPAPAGVMANATPRARAA